MLYILLYFERDCSNILASPNACPKHILLQHIPLLMILFTTPQLNKVTTNKQPFTCKINQQRTFDVILNNFFVDFYFATQKTRSYSMRQCILKYRSMKKTWPGDLKDTTK